MAVGCVVFVESHRKNVSIRTVGCCRDGVFFGFRKDVRMVGSCWGGEGIYRLVSIPPSRRSFI